MPAMDAVMTTAPRWPSLSGSCCAIAAAANRSTLYVPTRNRSIVLVKPPSAAAEPSLWTPFSAMPQPPCATTAKRNGASCSASAIAASTLASSVTSVCTYLALGPSSAASLPARSSDTSPITTDAPAPMSLRTVASPSPPAPPVTRTELPATSTMPKSSSLLTGRVLAAPCCALLSEQFENRRVGLPAALAHGLQAVADAVVAHVVHEGGHQPGAAAAERVAERDRAPVDVQRLGVRAELGEPGERHRREGLVYLEGTDVADSQPALGQGLRGRRDGRGEHDDRVVSREHRGVHPGDGGKAEFRRLLAGSHQEGGGAVADLRAVPRVDHTVFLEGRLKLAERLQRSPAPHSLVGAHDAAVVQRDSRDLAVEPACVLGGRRLLVRG